MTSARHIALLFPPHPTLEQPTVEELARMKPPYVRELSKIWIESIENAALDPLRAGDHPPHWFDALAELEDPEIDGLSIFGGNRGAKTEFGAYLIMRALIENPGTTIFCWCQTKTISHLVQQPRIYKFLPPEYRKPRDDDEASIHYKIATGFVNDRFTLPNGSTCMFWYYTQYQLNSNLVEGLEIGWKGKYGDTSPFVNVGNWFDEEVSPKLMGTIEERLSTRDAKNLITFTPINQYSETVEEILKDVETVVEEKTLPDDPEQIRNMSVPYIQRKESRSVIYFATRKNPYHNYDRSKRNMAGKSRDWVLMKLYGVPTKVNSSKFPSWDKEVHVVPNLPKFERVDNGRLTEYEPTRYHIIVPAGDRPWFMLWVAVDHEGSHYVYREWPRHDEEGSWAERRDGEWDWGDACKGDCCGMGSRAYKNLLDEMESGEAIAERIVSKGFETVVDDMSDLDIYFAEIPEESEQEGFQRIHTLLEEPKLKILSHCKNLCGAMVGYDVEKGRTNNAHPYKPPIDALRLMATAELDYIFEPRAGKRFEDEGDRRAWGGY